MEDKIHKCEKCIELKTYEEMAKDASRSSGLKKLCKKHESERVNNINKKSKQRAREIGYTYKLQKQEAINNNFQAQIDNLYKMLKELKDSK